MEDSEEREPEPWETNARAPFLSVDTVAIQSLGEDRFLVVAPTEERTVGLRARAELAHKLAARS